MTLSQTILRKIEQAYEAWDRAGRPGLFCTFLERREEGLLALLPGLPDVITRLKRSRDGRKIARELQQTPKRKPLPHATLALFMDEITLAYQRKPGRKGTFDAFLEQIRQECATEEELNTHLRRMLL